MRAFSSSTQEAQASGSLEFMASLVYRVSSSQSYIVRLFQKTEMKRRKGRRNGPKRGREEGGRERKVIIVFKANKH